MQTALADPMLVAAGLQVIRAIGVKRLIPILAVGGSLLGFWRAATVLGHSDDEARKRDPRAPSGAARSIG